MKDTTEYSRLLQARRDEVDWRLWGPYLSERSWGTVREDYSPGGTAWNYFPHDHARSRTYRWNEDGLAGISDRQQYLCFALALWNGRDPILKERLFGLTGPEGNHGEDVKEVYYYLDSTPTHSWMRMLYKYPQGRFPYEELVAENGRRGVDEPEYELLDTGAFSQDRYFDVFIAYAKDGPDDVLVEITAHNRGPDAAPLTLLPSLWFRNTWSWGYERGPMMDVPEKPVMRVARSTGLPAIRAEHPVVGAYRLIAPGADELIFTENETNRERLYGVANASPYVKDAFHRCLIDDKPEAVNPAQEGTKAAAVYRQDVASGESVTIRLRLSAERVALEDPLAGFESVMTQRREEADAFYAAVHAPQLNEDERRVQRQALAGMLWSKQLYYYDVKQWLQGDPAGPPPPAVRLRGRNHDWDHLNNFDILSMPDKWEYPWYAAWDLAFHCIPLAMVDPEFAKRQLVLMTRVWYMHASGQLPAYEWAFGDVNPPVHAWAAWRVYQLDAKFTGEPDRAFLNRVFHKLLLNFTWWVNRKDEDGLNIFQGGFLGLDNISLFDRSATLPTGGHIDQADGTAWMAFYSLTMLEIALELAKEQPLYQDLGTKFFEHFLAIARAMVNMGGRELSLWDEEDGFFYDVLHLPDDRVVPLKVRSMVGLIPLLAVTVLEPELMEKMPAFAERMHWFLRHRPQRSRNIASIEEDTGIAHLVAILTKERLISVLRFMLDETEFLSPYGIRSLSKVHRKEPFSLTVDGQVYSIAYEPAESRSQLFGGNSNWRGPIWFPINYLLIEALLAFHRYHEDNCRVECPTGSGNWLTLKGVAHELARRQIRLFLRDDAGRRPAFGRVDRLQEDLQWRDLLLFHEYFHGDHGTGLGASHQTGWTGLVATLLQRFGGSTNLEDSQ